MEQVCQELGIPTTSDLPTVIEHIRVLKRNFKDQVLVASRLPLANEVEGQGPAITAPGNRSVIEV